MFLFENGPMGEPSVSYTVTADLDLARKHGIQTQELGLACRRLLEQQETAGRQPVMEFSEHQMVVYVDDSRAARSAVVLAKKALSKPIASTASPIASSVRSSTVAETGKSYLPQRV